MPCRSDYMEPTPREIIAMHHEETKAIKVELDRLTRENDLLREMVINLDQGGKLTATELALVKNSQMDHRKEDLARLEKTLREAIATGPSSTYVYEQLGRVITADPSQPLEPQLGFDPDSV